MKFVLTRTIYQGKMSLVSVARDRDIRTSVIVKRLRSRDRAEGERDTHARTLYEQARSLEASLDFSLAIDKYERAYAQLSDSHAFAFRIAESAWMAQLCEKAAEHYRIFTTKIDAGNASYAADLQRASEILAKVDALGCPDALYTRAEVIPAEPAGGDEQPPASKAACAVVEGDGERGVVGLLMLGLLGLVRRRRPSGTL